MFFSKANHYLNWIWFSYYSSWLSELLLVDLIRSLFSLHSSPYFFSASLPLLVWTNIKCVFPIMFMNVLIYYIDNNILRIYAIWCHITKFLIYFFVIRIFVIDIDHVIEKVPHGIFISISFTLLMSMLIL